MQRNWVGVVLWSSIVLVLLFTAIKKYFTAGGVVRKAFVYGSTTENIT